MQMLFRFVIGGTVVSLFAMLGDVVRPKSFAGILGAAPSIALATLTLTAHEHGPAYVATEARSMVVGAIALTVYAWLCCRAMWTGRASSLAVTSMGLPVWLIVAMGLWAVFLRSAS